MAVPPAVGRRAEEQSQTRESILPGYRPRYGAEWRHDPLLRFSQRALARLDVESVLIAGIDSEDLVPLSFARLDDAGDVVGHDRPPGSAFMEVCHRSRLTEKSERFPGADDRPAAAAVPIQDPGGLAIGVYGVLARAERTWSTEDLEFLEALALACAGEIRMRRLEQAARTSVERAETSRARTRVLLQLSEGFASATTVRDVARTVMQLSIHALNASYGNVRLLDANSRALRHVDLGDFPGYPTPIYRTITTDQHTPSSRAVATRRPSFYDDIDQFGTDFPDIVSAARQANMHSFAHLPLMVDHRTLGAISISWPTPRTFDQDDRAVIQALARYTAQAVDRALLLAGQRDVAQTLQAAMLSDLPEHGDLALAARYLPAVASERVGGDWYDAFGGPGSSTTLVVGDVSGHDMHAAAIMGQLRSMLRALGTDVPDSPSRLLERLERTMQQLGFETLTTALVANIARTDDGGATVTVSNAGHLPALLIEDGKPPRYLDGHDRLLGLERPAPRRDHSHRVGRNSTVVLYTDGLVERRSDDLDVTLAALAAVADQYRALSVEELVDAMLDEISVDRTDDTVILAARLKN